MKRIYSKEEVCIGCRLCEVHCTVQHSKSKEIITAFKKEVPRAAPRVNVEERGNLSFGIQCRHCENPACVQACISGAMRKMESGEVILDEEICVGCWTCILVCPFGAVTRNDKRAAKCDLCKGMDIPVCVANCPNDALVFEER